MKEPPTSASAAGQFVGTSCAFIAGPSCYQRLTGAVASDDVTLQHV